MSLGIAYGPVWDVKNEYVIPDSWYVYIVKYNNTYDEDALVGGFGRRQDAEIAKDVLDKLDLDWDLPGEEYIARGYPLWDERMKMCCEVLQW